MANPYLNIWMKAGETAVKQTQAMALADIHTAQIEASKKMVNYWFDACTSPYLIGRRPK